MANYKQKKRMSKRNFGAPQQVTNMEDKLPYNPKNKNKQDVSWYSKNVAVLRDAASISFNNPLGTSFPTANGYQNITVDSTEGRTVPGILKMGVVPGIGKSTEAQSAANIASKAIYSFVRHANSGHSNYDSPDLMMYLLALDTPYYMFAYAKRAYNSCFTYSQRNRFMPRRIVEAEGWDYDDLVSQLADFREYLNEVAIRLRSFYVPKTMPLHERHAWLFTGVWSDSEDVEKSQLYMYYPQGYYTYNEHTGGKGYLEWHWLFTPGGNPNGANYKLTVAKFRAIMESILQPLIASEDIGIMSGDILKAYKDSGNFYTVKDVEPREPLSCVHDEMVLRQIQNAVIVRTESTTALGFNIDQDVTVGSPTEGCILYNPYPVSASSGTITPSAGPDISAINKILNAGTINPDPGYVAEITRFSTTYRWVTDTGGGYHSEFINLGSEFISEAMACFIDVTGSNNMYYNLIAASRRYYNNWASTQSDIANGMALTAFDFHPELLFYLPGTVSYLYKLFDYENYTSVNPDDLIKIDSACIFSLFGIPL